MKKKLLFMMTFLAIAGMVSAQNALTVTDFTLPQNGGKMVVNLTLGEASVYTSYQFKVETPAGVAYVVDGDDDVECTLGTGHTASHGATAHWNATDKLLTIGVISTGSTLLTGQSVTLEIPLAATTATVGTQYNFTIKDITFIRQSGVKDYLSNVSFKATVGTPEVVRIVFDEEASSLPNYTAGATANVKVKRTIKANEWSTICLPFSIPAAQMATVFGTGVELAEFNGWETTEYDNDDNALAIQVSFNNASGIEANTPYIIKVTEAKNELLADDVVLEAEDEPFVSKGKKSQGTYGTFCGSYTPLTIDEECLFLSSNNFWYSTGSTAMKGYRCYFYFWDVLASYSGGNARITMQIENGETTGINNMNTEKEENEKFYNLQGNRIQKPTKKGVYVRNGSKMIIN